MAAYRIRLATGCKPNAAWLYCGGGWRIRRKQLPLTAKRLNAGNLGRMSTTSNRRGASYQCKHANGY